MYDLGDYDDLLLVGAVKTLVPTLVFGGEELFFQVCIIGLDLDRFHNTNKNILNL